MTDTRADTTALGISVVDDQISSVVRAGDGTVLASNLVDLAETTADQVTAAIEELVASVPMDIDQIGIAVADDALRTHLSSAFTPGPASADWYSKLEISDFPTALVEVARAQATRDGVVAVVDLDRAAAPSIGPSAVTVDVATGRLIGTSVFGRDDAVPVTEADGASALADTVTTMPGGERLTSVLCTGPGAEIPGVAPAFEYAVQRPVTIADQPTLAPALGAAELAGIAEAPTTLTRVASSSTGRRWWFIGAAIGAAIVLGAIAITAVLAAEKGVTESSTVTTTVTATPSTRTVVRTEAAETVTETATRTTTVTSTGRPVTRTRTVTETAEPATTTVTETVPQTPEIPGNPYENGTGDDEDGTP